MDKNEIRTTALDYRANLIETGTLTLSAQDVRERANGERNVRLKTEWLGRIRPLDGYQSKMVETMRRLAIAARTGEDGIRPGSEDGMQLAFGLDSWANNIETGNPLMSRLDVLQRSSSLLEINRAEAEKMARGVRSLDLDQLAFVRRLRKMADEADGRIRPGADLAR